MTFFKASLWGLMALFVVAASLPASSSENTGGFKAKAINHYCMTPDVYDNAIAAFVEHGPGASWRVFMDAAAIGQCVVLEQPYITMFMPTSIYKRYAKGRDGPEFILEGSLPSGVTVYHWIDQEDIGHYRHPES